MSQRHRLANKKAQGKRALELPRPASAWKTLESVRCCAASPLPPSPNSSASDAPASESPRSLFAGRGRRRTGRGISTQRRALIRAMSLRQSGPAAGPHTRAAFRARPAAEPSPPPPRPHGVSSARAGLPRCGTQRTRNSGRLYSGDWNGTQNISRSRTYGSSCHSGFFSSSLAENWLGLSDRPALKRAPTSSARLRLHARSCKAQGDRCKQRERPWKQGLSLRARTAGRSRGQCRSR